MLSFQRIKTLFYLKGFIRTLPPTSNLNPNFPIILSTISHQNYHYSTITTDDEHSFTVSYLTNNCGFSLETALTASKQVHFNTAQKADYVLAFFRNHGFSDSQIHSIIRRAPHILKCDPHRKVLPKFEFLRSKGASSSDIVVLVNRCPRFLYTSLENSIIPSYESVRRYSKSDKKTIDYSVVCPSLLSDRRAEKNINILVDVGVRESQICYLLRTRASVLVSNCDVFKESVNEVKEMGFDPSQHTFVIALLAKRGMAKSRWDAKVEAFKSWGWSQEKFLEAFRNKPSCMLSSIDKINQLMRFWVSQLGWNSLAPAEWPGIFGFSLEKRIIPRAIVVQHLLTKGLMKTNASLYTPFTMTEKLFLERYVMRFKQESSLLLKLYQGKMNVQDNNKRIA